MSRGTIKLTIILGISIISFSACGVRKEVIQEEVVQEEDMREEVMQEEEPIIDEISVEEIPVKEEAECKEIPIDYPFPYGMEGYTLALVPSEAYEGEYDIRLCNETGRAKQQFLFGKIMEPLNFAYDDLTYDLYQDLEIFMSAGEVEDCKGLLFVWDWKNSQFMEEAIEIPEYDDNRWGGVLASKENEDCQEYFIYQVNEDKKETYELRRWILAKDTKDLQIWDCLEEEYLYDGKVDLDEEGNLINDEYFQTIFWRELPMLGNYGADSEIMVWISGEDTGQNAEYQNIEGFEYVQRELWGNDGCSAKYEDRQTFLSDFGFGDKEPLYQFYDRFHNLQMELYLDEESLKGCGIRYKYYYTNEMEKVVFMHGFTFDTVFKQKWGEPDIFSVKAYDGRDGADSVSEYEEFIEYTEDGKLDYFKSQGMIDWLGDEEDVKEPSDILEINFVYRDDGTLYRKEYVHNSNIFGTTCTSIESFYDEKERLLYEDCYITHGSYEYYYIYKDDGKKPAYCLGVDDNLGYFMPTMMQF